MIYNLIKGALIVVVTEGILLKEILSDDFGNLRL
jgi:hypothetical protein